MELIDEGMCFVCGKHNPIGLRVEFDTDRENLRISGVFTPRREHEGYKGILHGGLVAALLDEAMVKILWEAGIPAVSASLEIRLARPARVGEPLRIEGWVDSQKGKLVLTGARVEDQDGRVIAEAKARCMKIDFKEAERGKPDQAKGTGSAI